MDDNLKAVEYALTNKPKARDISDMLDQVTKMLEESRATIEDVRRSLVLIQKSLGGNG
jgi:hypothetical protein